MLRKRFLNSAKNLAKISEVLADNIGMHDLWSKEGHQAELFAIEELRHVGLNRDDYIAGIVNVKALVVQAGSDEPASVTAYSMFVMTRDLTEVKDFGYIPGHSIIYPQLVIRL